MPGNRNTTKCENVGEDEKVKAYCVSEIMIGFVRTGLEGRMRPNGEVADMGRLLFIFLENYAAEGQVTQKEPFSERPKMARLKD